MFWARNVLQFIIMVCIVFNGAEFNVKKSNLCNIVVYCMV